MKDLFILFAFLLVGCYTEPKIQSKSTGMTYGDHTQLMEIEYEGCKYIGSFKSSNTDWGTHKGNCTNPIHKNK